MCGLWRAGGGFSPHGTRSDARTVVWPARGTPAPRPRQPGARQPRRFDAVYGTHNHKHRLVYLA